MIEEMVENKKNETYDKEAYKKKKYEQLQNAYNTIDEATNDIKNNPNFFKLFLDVQSQFDKYTVRNAMLIAKQLPTAKKIKDYKGWREQGVYFKNKFPKRIIILEPRESYINSDGKTVTPFSAKEMIDISETNLKYSFKSYDSKIILQALLHSTSLDVKVVDSLENQELAKWDKDTNVIYVARSEDCDKIIKDLSKEISKAKLYEDINEVSVEKSICMGYMLCKKYNINFELNNIQELNTMFDNKEITEIKEELSQIKDSFDEINNSMERYLYEKENRDKSQEIER